MIIKIIINNIIIIIINNENPKEKIKKNTESKYGCPNNYNGYSNNDKVDIFSIRSPLSRNPRFLIQFTMVRF